MYAQLADILRRKIDSGEWIADQKIPSENELNQQYGISRMTARQVLSQLVSEQLLFRVQGKGTFVARPKISTRSLAYKGIREQLEAMGYAITTKVLESTEIEADAVLARILRLDPGDRVHLIRRLRLIEDEPISLHISYVPESLAPELDTRDLVTRQLCTILETDHGLRMTKVTERLESTLPIARDAKDLQVRRTAPLLLLTHEIADQADRPFEYSRILFRGDKVQLEFKYEL
ncbi:MAG: GntR family transcriptional regulator [Nakamurella sp.]